MTTKVLLTHNHHYDKGNQHLLSQLFIGIFLKSINHKWKSESTKTEIVNYIETAIYLKLKDFKYKKVFMKGVLKMQLNLVIITIYKCG